MIDKHAKPTKLFWVDLEMTGLDTDKDVILEVAAEITDFDFKTLANYESRVRQDTEIATERMRQNVWWNDYPENRDDFLRKLDGARAAEKVEQDLVALLAAHFGSEPAVLAGNSIHKDREFIKRWWPALESKLHYRMLDVSSFKLFMQGRYGVEFEKKEIHRAFDDIRASIAELEYYLEWLKKHEQGRRV